MEQVKKIAVIGGSGKAGKYLVRQLIRQGYKIKVLLRKPEKLEISDQSAEKITGDVRNPDSLISLIGDCNVVISTLGFSKGESPVFSTATENLIRAMHTLNVKRYIVVTGLTLDTKDDKKKFRTRFLSWLMKLSFPAIIADKQKEYNILSASDLDWTVIRLPFIEQTESAGEIKISLADCPGKKISATDLADFLIGQISDVRYIRKSPFISN